MTQPFIREVTGSVDALNKMAGSLEAQLDSLLSFFGEIPDSPESPKPEDFFGLVLTFSTSLQVRGMLLQYTSVLTNASESCFGST